MPQPDYRGARGSNAGDDFHELWALRQSLTLLDPRTRLVAVAVEGLRAEDEHGVPTDTWDGVDCTFYFEGSDVSSAKQIVIDQLKYSSANPEKTWTVSRLTNSTNKRGDNSVIARLAKVFGSLSRMRPDLLASGDLRLRLVSNQRINPAVTKALEPSRASGKRSEREKKDRAVLMAASGLRAAEFNALAGALDLSECGSRSRFATEEKVLLTIASWTEDDARLNVDHLMRFIRRMMMPEAKGEVITRESILAQLGFSDPGALFPCPSTIQIVPNLVKREEAEVIVSQLLAGNERVCYHGVAGCGKTTLLHDIASRLPQGSVLLIYDCYGSGRYLDSDAYRHRPQDAFLQLSNELAQRLRTPLLVTRSPKADYPRVFKGRLALASEVVRARSAEAIIVVVADAADNSITAAETQSERSFIHDLVSLGDLPGNVRLLVTSRTSRLQGLNLPQTFGTPLEIKGFSRAETASYVGSIWGKPPDSWIDDFQYLSDGNPRVQSYSLSYGKGDPDRALEYLRPHGKKLDNVFEEQLGRARTKVGAQLDVKTLCAALIALPRPVPLEVLSVVTKLSAANISDLCADLAPGVSSKNDLISFADEDFEHFIRAEAGEDLRAIYDEIANYLSSIHTADPYAATHIGSALSNAGRGLEIIEIIRSGDEPSVIGDPVLRRQVQLERLKLAMKVCREVGSEGDAMLTTLFGAEALKTDEAIRNILIQNPDLTAIFARDTSSRMILRDPSQIATHGSLLFHFMAADALKDNGILVREGFRQVQAWLQRREQDAKDHKATNAQAEHQRWSIDSTDVAAEIEAILRIAGPQQAADTLKRWRPRALGLSVVQPLAAKLVNAGNHELVERCITEGVVPAPWDLFLLVPLALAGRKVELSSLRTSLATLLRRGLIRLDSLVETWGEENPVGDYLETIVTACEIVGFRGGDTAGTIVSVLERLAESRFRQTDRLYTSQVRLIDLSARAKALLERFSGRKFTLETYLIDPAPPSEDLPQKERDRLTRMQDERKTELQRLIGPFVDLYDARAQLIVGSTMLAKAQKALEQAVPRSLRADHHLRFEHRLPGMQAQVALSLARLVVIPKLNREVLFESALSALGPANPFNSSETSVLRRLSADKALHQKILARVNSGAIRIEGARLSSEAKIEALVRFSRLLLTISPADAQSLFNRAIGISGELNSEAVHEIALFEPLAERASDAMSADKQRSAANNLAAVVSDAWIRLEGPDSFPWEKVAGALSTLDLSIALAVTARWEDSAIIHRSALLPEILKAALSRKSLLPGQAAAFMPLLEYAEEDLIIAISRSSREVVAANSDQLAEELAREELLRFGYGRRGAVNDELASKTSRSSMTYWLDKLAKAAVFHQGAKSQRKGVGSLQQRYIKRGSMDRFRWKKTKYGTSSAINGAVSQIRSSAGEEYIAVAVILDRMAREVDIADRVAHLEALRESQSVTIHDDELIRAIFQRLEDWRNSPSVVEWARARSLDIVTEWLPTFTRWLSYDQQRVKKYLRQSGATDSEISAALLKGIERHVDSLDAATVYSLVGLIGFYCNPNDAARVLDEYAKRLVDRIPAADRDRDILDLNDIPTKSSQGIARYIYALLSDVDVRIRWRAAHALRSLGRLGEINTISSVVALYDQTNELSYRRPDAPFYWLASRLWLLIALDRISSETPASISHLGHKILAIGSDANFPHVLLRSFAKTAVTKLVDSGVLKLEPSEAGVLEHINVSPVPSVESGSHRDTKFLKYNYEGREGRLFTFDTMDTLPHWYSGAISAFADVGKEEFLDIAEEWIVVRWGVASDPWRWDDEPRQNRLSDEAFSSHHRDGSLPTGERFHFYLEWHSMWCVIGQLMERRALADLQNHDYDSLHRQLAKNGLSEPPIWLADLNGPTLLEERSWTIPSKDVDKWMEGLTDDDFLAELESEHGQTTVISGIVDNRSRYSRATSHVHSALVNPATGTALVRALQTVPHHWDYRLPSIGDDFEIHDSPYELKGWIEDRDYSSGIDQRDPLRFDLSPIQSMPSDEVTTSFNLQLAFEDQPRWRNVSGETVVSYRAWSNVRWSDNGQRILYGEHMLSSGYQLCMNREALKEYLDRLEMDLIVEVQITRGNRGDESRYDQENAKEYDGVDVFRLVEDSAHRVSRICIKCVAPRQELCALANPLDRFSESTVQVYGYQRNRCQLFSLHKTIHGCF